MAARSGPRRWGRRPTTGTLTAMGLLAAQLLVLMACNASTGEPAAGLQPGDSAPAVEFRTLNGERLSLQSFDGPVLVNFWATDCHICVAETPMLTALWERWHDEGYHFVAVAMPHDRPDAVVEMVSSAGWRHPVAIDIEGVALAAFGDVPGTPTSFLFSAEGLLDRRLVGHVDGAALERRIRELLDTTT